MIIQDKEGHYTGFTNWCTPAYNGTQKPWFEIVSSETGPESCWTSVYVGQISGSTYISFSYAARGTSNALIAITGVDFIIGKR